MVLSRCEVCYRDIEEDERLCIVCENRQNRPEKMRYDNEYAGETDAKRISRLRCFNVIAESFKRFGDPGGWAVTLAGPEAAEVGVFRYMLRWPRDRVLFVDHDPQGLRRAERLWPGVDTYCGDVVDVLKFLDGGIGFAHFDFMGHLNSTAQETFELAGSMLKNKGVMMYTYFRGRERNTKLWHLAQEYSKQYICQSLAEKRLYRQFSDKQRKALTRELGYINVAISLLKKRSVAEFSPIITGANYQSTSPMGVLAVQKFLHLPKRLPLPGHFSPIKGGDESRKLLRNITKCLRDYDWSNREISAVLNIDEKSVPAWIAHVTRGTYG